MCARLFSLRARLWSLAHEAICLARKAFFLARKVMEPCARSNLPCAQGFFPCAQGCGALRTKQFALRARLFSLRARLWSLAHEVICLARKAIFLAVEGWNLAHASIRSVRGAWCLVDGDPSPAFGMASRASAAWRRAHAVGEPGTGSTAPGAPAGARACRVRRGTNRTVGRGYANGNAVRKLTAPYECLARPNQTNAVGCGEERTASLAAGA